MTSAALEKKADTLARKAERANDIRIKNELFKKAASAYSNALSSRLGEKKTTEIYQSILYCYYMIVTTTQDQDEKKQYNLLIIQTIQKIDVDKLADNFDRADLYHSLMLAQLENGQPEEAANSAKKIIALFPKLSEFYEKDKTIVGKDCSYFAEYTKDYLNALSVLEKENERLAALSLIEQTISNNNNVAIETINDLSNSPSLKRKEPDNSNLESPESVAKVAKTSSTNQNHFFQKAPRRPRVLTQKDIENLSQNQKKNRMTDQQLEDAIASPKHPNDYEAVDKTAYDDYIETITQKYNPIDLPPVRRLLALAGITDNKTFEAVEKITAEKFAKFKTKTYLPKTISLNSTDKNAIEQAMNTINLSETAEKHFKKAMEYVFGRQNYKSGLDYLFKALECSIEAMNKEQEIMQFHQRNNYLIAIYISDLITQICAEKRSKISKASAKRNDPIISQFVHDLSHLDPCLVKSVTLRPCNQPSAEEINYAKKVMPEIQHEFDGLVSACKHKDETHGLRPLKSPMNDSIPNNILDLQNRIVAKVIVTVLQKEQLQKLKNNLKIYGFDSSYNSYSIATNRSAFLTPQLRQQVEAEIAEEKLLNRNT